MWKSSPGWRDEEEEELRAEEERGGGGAPGAVGRNNACDLYCHHVSGFMSSATVEPPVTGNTY